MGIGCPISLEYAIATAKDPNSYQDFVPRLISAANAQHLENTTLQVLTLCGCLFDQQRLNTFAEALKCYPSLEFLELELCVFGEGVVEILSAALRTNTSLQAMSIKNCDVSKEDIERGLSDRATALNFY